MFSLLLTAAITIGAQPDVAVTSDLSMHNPHIAAVEVIVDSTDSNYVSCNCHMRSAAMGSGLSCDCIRSSANYPWNWLVSVKKFCSPSQISPCGFPVWGKKTCPPYYAFYDSPYNFRRSLDYQWRSPIYRPRNVAPRHANSTKGCSSRTKPGDRDNGLVPTMEEAVAQKIP